MKNYVKYATDKTLELLAIDSPTGYTKEAAKWVKGEFDALGFDAKITNKGGVLVNIGSEGEENGLLLEAHADTLGEMVAEIKGNGRLRVTNLGGMRAENAEAENVRVHMQAIQDVRAVIIRYIFRMTVLRKMVK